MENEDLEYTLDAPDQDYEQGFADYIASHPGEFIPIGGIYG